MIGGGSLESGVPGTTSDRPGRRRAPAWVSPLIAVALVVGAFFAGRLTGPPTGEGSIRVSTLSQGSRDTEPAVSPDGRLIAFGAVRQNGLGIWLMDMVTRSEVKLTSGADGLPRFTSDGGSILFTRVENGRQALSRIPVIGGTPRLLLEGAADADPSPDGKWIAYISSSTDSGGVHAQLTVARSDGTGARGLWSRGPVVLGSPRWSPDARRISLILSGSQN